MRPVPGPSVSPVIAWPAAMVMLRHRDAGPMIGTPSGVTGRSPAHRRRTRSGSSSSSRRRANASSLAIRSSVTRCVEVVELEPGTEAQFLAQRSDRDVVLAEQHRPTRSDAGTIDGEAQPATGEHRDRFAEQPGDPPRPGAGGEHHVPGPEVALARAHGHDPLVDDPEVDDLAERLELDAAAREHPLDEAGHGLARMDAAVSGR